MIGFGRRFKKDPNINIRREIPLSRCIFISKLLTNKLLIVLSKLISLFRVFFFQIGIFIILL